MIELPEGAKIATFTIPKLISLWKKAKVYSSIFTDEMLDGGVHLFCEMLLNKNTVTVEIKGGLLILQNIIHGLRGEVHFILWDSKLSSKAMLMKELLLWAFLSFELERIETFVASYARAIMRFLERKLGFQMEGVMRNRVRNKGELTDLYVYSILKSEVLE